MKLLLFIFFGFTVTANTVFAQEPVDSSGQDILIINTFDPSAGKMRKNKAELFLELADSLKEYLAKYVSEQLTARPVIVPGCLKDTSSASLQELFNQYKVNTGLLITKLDVYFEQTGVEVTRDNDGKKEREASYDICCIISYTIYKSGITTSLPDEKNCEFFTRRNVVSGAFAAGPDVVAKKKYTYGMVQKNAFHFLAWNRLLLSR